MSRRARLTVAYVGTDLHGFAEADGVRTVMGELRGVIEKVVRQAVDKAVGQAAAEFSTEAFAAAVAR